MRMSVIERLLDSDPSIRWQVMRDLIAEPDATVARERSRVAAEGWGTRLPGQSTPNLPIPTPESAVRGAGVEELGVDGQA
jgi:hypothetical protein